jgi:1-acyl-sn-glycerol-3-phosphate acyltransferase
MHRFRWQGEENVPRAGPAIIASNHQSFYDPVLITFAAGRRVTFLAWDYFCKKPVLGPLMRAFDAVPVDLDNPEPSSLRQMVRTLRSGRLCGIFPEGGRSTDGLLMPAKRGVGALALRTGTPIIPVTISGAHQAWPLSRALPLPGPISIRFGTPIMLHRPDRGSAAALRIEERELTRRVMLRIADGFDALGQAQTARLSRERLLAADND